MEDLENCAIGASGWRPAAFFQPQGRRLVCALCPRYCSLKDGETGYCGVRRRRGAGMETATYAASVRHLDAVERKPLYHVLPGSRWLTLAAPGCTFRCSYCQNFRLSQWGRSSETVWDAAPVTAALLADEQQAQGAAGIAFSYSEPGLAAELTLELAALGIPLIWKTNGFLTATALKRLAPALLAVNVDLKSIEPAAHRRLTGADCAPVMAALEAFRAAGVWVEVSTPLIPGVNDSEAQLHAMAGFLADVDPFMPWHLLRFSPEYRMRDQVPTTPLHLERARQLGLERGLHFVYVERALGLSGRATNCPNCDRLLLQRGVWRLEDNRLLGDCCPCGTRLPGLWRMDDVGGTHEDAICSLVAGSY